jgi:hypothetical protein
MGVPATAVDDYLRDLRDRPDTFRARAGAPRKNGSPGVVELTLGTLGAVDDKLVADAIAPPTLAVVVGQPEASALFAPQNRCARPLGAHPPILKPRRSADCLDSVRSAMRYASGSNPSGQFSS